MKTEESYDNKKYIYNPKPEIDDFWSDCIELKEKKQSITNNKYNNNIKANQKLNSKKINNNRYKNSQYQPFKNRNINYKYKKSNIRTYNSIKLFNPKNKKNNNLNSSNNSLTNNNKLNNSMEKYLENLYNRHPSYIEEKKEEENKKIKSKNALIRCIGLYAYGLELQKTKKMNKENTNRQKIKNDMSNCTFKPKINKKIAYLDDKISYTRGINRLYNPKKFLNKSLDNIHNNKSDDNIECTFNPKLVNNPKSLEKMFNKTIEDDKIAGFLLRYTKARDEYLIKRFKKMYRKDDNYDKSLLSLTKRLCNKEYRNYLNVNNTIHIFGETKTPDNNFNSSIANFKGFSYYNDKSDEKRLKKANYIEGLRKNLLSLDLNENVEE